MVFLKYFIKKANNFLSRIGFLYLDNLLKNIDSVKKKVEELESIKQQETEFVLHESKSKLEILEFYKGNV